MSVDPLAPLEGEGLTAYLLRTRPQYEWNDDGGTAEPVAEATLNDGYQNFVVRLRARVSRAEWSAYVGTVYPAPITVDVNVPPVWPGLANVTLGEPVALAQGVTITTPMDGVVVSITGASSGTMWFTYDDLRSWRNVGALTFLDEEGHAEGYQALGFTSEVYVPRRLKQASGVKVMGGRGVSGTITPWLENT